MRDVLIGAGRVHHQKQVIAPVGDHQIVQHATIRGGEQPVTLPHFRQADDIRGHQRFQRHGGISGHPRGRAQNHLPHMADIEQPGLAARLQMFAHHAHRVLHRHFPASEGHHLAAKGDMQVIKRGAFQIRHGASSLRLKRGLAAPSVPARLRAPEIVILRRAKRPLFRVSAEPVLDA